MQPGTHLLLDNLNIVKTLKYCDTPYRLHTFWTAEALSTGKSEQITGAGLGQPGKSYHAVPTGEFNWRTSGNPCVIAFIEAPLKSRVWRSKFVIFHTCPIFFLKISCCIV